MKWILIGTLTAAFLLGGTGSNGQEKSYSLFDVKRGARTTLDREVPDFKASRIILVGERHTEIAHHQAQLAVIRGLHEGGESVAVGLEMFRAESQEVLERWVAGHMSRDDFRKAYLENWSFPWTLYSMIFDYARERAIPLVGLNIPRAITRQVSRKGFQSLSTEQRSQLPDTVVCNVDEEYMAFIQRAYGAHAHGSMNFTYFCEAQLVWDQAMAIAALRYLDANPGRTLVILAGTGHTWKPGIPRQIRLRSSLPQLVVLPLIPGAIEPGITTLADADYIIDTHPPGP